MFLHVETYRQKKVPVGVTFKWTFNTKCFRLQSSSHVLTLTKKKKHKLWHFTSLRFFFISSKSIPIILIFCYAAELAGRCQLKCPVLWAQPAFSHFSLTCTLRQLHHSHPAVLWRLVTECQMCRFTSTASQFLTKKPFLQRRNWPLSISRKDVRGFTYSPHTDK